MLHIACHHTLKTLFRKRKKTYTGVIQSCTCIDSGEVAMHTPQTPVTPLYDIHE